MKFTDPQSQLEDPENIKKYKTAGLIATKTVNEILKYTKPNSKLLDLHIIGNKFISTELTTVYKDIKNKGISFPLCLSVNDIAGYYIPNGSEQSLNNGDILKIELGIHIDGFNAPICYTTIVSDSKINDKKKQDLLTAITDASKQIMEVMKPGNTNLDVAKILEDNAKKYNCYLPSCNIESNIPGEFSYQISQYVNDGNNDDDDEYVHNFILTKNNDKFDFVMQESEFEKDDVYAIDILMSTQPKLTDFGKCDIYKRDHKEKKLLKLDASKTTLNKFKNEYFPISLANCDTKIKMGIKECVNSKLIKGYPVVKCQNNGYICRVMFTVIVDGNPLIISGKSAKDEFNKFV